MSLLGGLGKMLGGGNLLGSLFDKIGMPWLGKIVNIALDIYTGNMAALVGDVANLASQFKGLGFLDKVAQFAPLGGFATGGGFGSSSFGGDCFGTSSSRYQDLSSVSNSKFGGSGKISKSIQLGHETSRNGNVVQSNRHSTMYGARPV